MKSSSRSHRLPSTTDPPLDDWIDGSWTVDCICGVNFDDGEEMVNCDECGVWVHTRCSRYIKGDMSFACHKCKAKNSRTNNNSNDSEETEVAQLLVELPTKTTKMKADPPCRLNNAPPPHRPYRFWAERPYEERVHVQGVPGGNPALFQGLSSIFTPQLWKATGYVPKKLSLQYREYPGWGEQQQDGGSKIEDSNNADKGVGVLYSLSKDDAETSPSTPEVGAQPENSLSSRKASRDKKSRSRHVHNNELLNVAKKDRSLLLPIVLHSGKRKSEEIGASKEHAGKKKSKEIIEEFDTKKNKLLGPISADLPPNHASYLDNGQGNDHKLLKQGTADSKHVHGRDTGSEEDASDYNLELNGQTQKPKSSMSPLENISGALSCEVSGHNHSVDKRANQDKVDHDSLNPVGGSPRAVVILPSLLVHDDAIMSPAKDKGKAVDDMDRKEGNCSESPAVGLQRSDSLFKDLACAAPEVKDNESLEKPDVNLLSSSHHNIVTEGYAGGPRGALKSNSADTEVKSVNTDDSAQNAVPSQHISGDCKVTATSSKSNEHKTLEVDLCSAAAGDCSIAKANEIYCERLSFRQIPDEQECHMGTPNIISESKNSPRVVEDTLTSGGPIFSQPLSSSQTKLASVVKSSSRSSSIVVLGSASDKFRSSNSASGIPVGKQVHPKADNNSKKDKPDSNLTRDEDENGPLEMTLQERSKSSNNPASRMLHQSRMYHRYASKHSPVDEKDPARLTSSKASSVESHRRQSSSVEPAGSLQNQGANKRTASALQPRGQRVLSNSQSSSKATYSTSGRTPVSTNCPAGLSDEELALLLHQELNSSPRVPRVPRMLHGGSFPQLSSASASGMLAKRTSGAGGKEQYPFSKRKSKDVCSFRESDNGKQKNDRVPSSPDSGRTGHTPNRAEGNSESLDLVQKSAPRVSATASGSVPFSTNANEQKIPLKRNSPKNNSDEDTASKGPAHRTLPALIAGIMSKGRRMTYEELCNAVLPHWHNLRKHNGERYAYSSHSQAVLDCLRNRSEWARLVDRGPKTNPSRKRRKTDAEPPNTESEDNGYGENASLKDAEHNNLEANTEDYPKGKRNVRKRKQLALHGRGVKDSRKRRKAEVLSDDGRVSFSGSMESESSEDESEDCERHEASGSSDETTTML
ncbi:hypothetical protein Dimus_034837 [Dionaea muscipula]